MRTIRWWLGVGTLAGAMLAATVPAGADEAAAPAPACVEKAHKAAGKRCADVNAAACQAFVQKRCSKPVGKAKADQGKTESAKLEERKDKSAAVDADGNLSFGKDGLGRIHGLGKIDTGGSTGRGANLGIGKRTGKKVAKVNIAQGEVSGGCDKGDVSKNVRARASSIRACYEMQLMTKPDLKGKLVVQWTISEDGATKGVKAAQDTMGSAPVQDCLLRTISRIQFAKPEEGMCVVQWPFLFEPG